MKLVKQAFIDKLYAQACQCSPLVLQVTQAQGLSSGQTFSGAPAKFLLPACPRMAPGSSIALSDTGSAHSRSVPRERDGAHVSLPNCLHLRFKQVQ